jgi:hypothetical protein
VGGFATSPVRLVCTGGDSLGTCALAARSPEGERIQVLVANNSSPADGYRLDFLNLPAGEDFAYEIHRIDETHEYDLVQSGVLSADSFWLEVSVEAPFVDHLVLWNQHATNVKWLTEETRRSIFLGPNTPNPFGPLTEITYRIMSDRGDSSVFLGIYDLLGRLVTTLVDDRQPPGAHTVRWDGTDRHGHPVAPGVYFYRLTRNRQSEMRRVIHVR